MQLVYLGPESVEEITAFLQPLRDLAPMVDTVGQWSYAQTQAAMLPAVLGLDAAFPDKRECERVWVYAGWVDAACNAHVGVLQ